MLRPKVYKVRTSLENGNILPIILKYNFVEVICHFKKVVKLRCYSPFLLAASIVKHSAKSLRVPTGASDRI